MKQAMVFAAGLGTRLRPLTDTMPKALVEVQGKPLLLHVLEKLKVSGYERIVVNVYHFADQIITYLKANDNFGLDIHISDERNLLLDTGGGLKKAAPLFKPNLPVLVHNVDILSNARFDYLEKAFEEMGDMDATLLVSARQTKRYLVFGQQQMSTHLPCYPLQGWTNVETQEVKPATLNAAMLSEKHLWAFSGIHLIHPRLLQTMETWPEKFSITDFYIKECTRARIGGLLQEGLTVTDVGKVDTLNSLQHP